jgi:hypothetical protein
MSSKIKISSGSAKTYGQGLIVGLCLAFTISSAGPAPAAPPAAAPAKPAPTKPAADKPAAEKPAGDKAAPAKAATTPEPVLENVVSASADDLITKPQDYVGKNVKFTANFFAFSNLALDYKPAFRSSKTHLSFLVLKPNSHVPLAELKLAMMIPKEKDPESTLLATLKDGDQLEMVGKVFSAALDDPWVEVFKVKKLNSAPEEKKTVASGGEAGSQTKTSDNKSTDGKAEGKDEKPADSKPKSSTPATK